MPLRLGSLSVSSYLLRNEEERERRRRGLGKGGLGGKKKTTGVKEQRQ